MTKLGSHLSGIVAILFTQALYMIARKMSSFVVGIVFDL
jgi:hypothetical protein